MNDMDDLRQLVDAARPVGEPTDEFRMRVRARILRQVGAATFATTVASTASAGKAILGIPLVAVAKTGMFLAVLGGAVAGAYSLKNPTSGSPEPVYIASAAPNAPAALPAAPTQATATAAATVLAPPEPAHESARENIPRTKRATPTPHAAVSTAKARPLDEELRLIVQAHAALRDGDPDRARALLDQKGPPPNAQLGEERETVRILAGCAAGEKNAATKAEQFVRQSARSPLTERVRRACALK
jgi:hypothetical protein